jgi:hypothetical protein
MRDGIIIVTTETGSLSYRRGQEVLSAVITENSYHVQFMELSMNTQASIPLSSIQLYDYRFGASKKP